MGVKKKQHYVPKFYLKFFADDANKFFAYDFKEQSILPEKVYFESQCHERFFYGEDGILEEQLSRKEREWATACKRIIAREELDNSDIMKLKEFVMYQRQRTSQTNRYSLEERETLIRECTRTIYLKNGQTLDKDAEKICKQRAKEEVSPAENVALASHAVDFIKYLAVLIVHYNTDRLLVTSDSPVIALNPFLRFQGFGYDSVGVVFLMPISPKDLLIVYDNHLFKNIDYECIECDNENEVIIVNRYELINAERMAFSSENQNFLLVTNDIVEKREREEKRNKTQLLGPEGNRLIISQAKGTDYYYDLPYLHLPREWRRIPYNCREAIPRHYEKGWGEKLAKKYQVLISAKNISRKETTKAVLPSKKDVKLGCRRMKKVAKTYWKSRGYDV